MPHQPEAASSADSGTKPQGASLFEEKSRTKVKGSAPGKSRLSLAELKALEEEREREVISGYKRIEELWPRMLHEGTVEREWMIEAEKLVEMFRETRNLFVTTRVIGWVQLYMLRRLTIFIRIMTSRACFRREEYNGGMM